MCVRQSLILFSSPLTYCPPIAEYCHTMVWGGAICLGLTVSNKLVFRVTCVEHSVIVTSERRNFTRMIEWVELYGQWLNVIKDKLS